MYCTALSRSAANATRLRGALLATVADGEPAAGEKMDGAAALARGGGAGAASTDADGVKTTGGVATGEATVDGAADPAKRRAMMSPLVPPTLRLRCLASSLS